jgi:glycerol-3-phosphate acyltransferase PlsY
MEPLKTELRTELPRQMVHLSGLVFVVFAQFIGREAIVIYLSMVALFFFVYSWYVRTQENRLEGFIGKFESRFRDLSLGLERKHVKNPFLGAMFYYIGCALAFAFFPFPVASAACAMLAVGDSLSNLVGANFGRRKIGGKTLEGSIACFLGSAAAGIFFVAPVLVLAGAAFAALAEHIPRVDDNLTIPIVSGLAMIIASLFV